MFTDVCVWSVCCISLHVFFVEGSKQYVIYGCILERINYMYTHIMCSGPHSTSQAGSRDFAFVDALEISSFTITNELTSSDESTCA